MPEKNHASHKTKLRLFLPCSFELHYLVNKPKRMSSYIFLKKVFIENPNTMKFIEPKKIEKPKNKKREVNQKIN